MSYIRTIAQVIRHTPGLKKAEWIWNVLRKPYHQLLNISGKGVEVSVGGCCRVLLPPEFCGGYWETYESEAIGVLVNWLQKYPNALVLDVGCAIGIISAVSLFASKQAEVIAFDSDLASIKATERMCQYAEGNRLHVVYGFISENHLSGLDADAAFAATQEALLRSGVTGDPGTNAYVCLGSSHDSKIPTHSLDRLLFANGHPGKPILLKCDVEGAELFVLRGAKHLLQDCSPSLLLSVHPPALPGYGQSVQDVRDYLENLGYSIQIISIDHEEHWWCEKKQFLG